MVTKSFRKELRGLSPWQLTMAVKEWMTNHDARLNITFNWKTPGDMKKISEEFKDEDFILLKSTKEKKAEKLKKVKYVKL